IPVAHAAPGAGNNFGSALASGDFNGDTYSDLAIGIPNKDLDVPGFPFTFHSLGQVIVIYGSPSGLTTTNPDVSDLRQHFNLRDGDVAEGAKLGQALAWGDFNGDGVGDLAIGAPNYTLDRDGLLADEAVEGGAVWVLYGRKSGVVRGGLSLTSNLLIQ